jgi:5-methylcytosine-specific restriction endonuclease McrA
VRAHRARLIRIRIRIRFHVVHFAQEGGDVVQTLVLNIGYQPVARVSWKKAILWILDRVVEVVDEYPDRYIRTPSWSVRMPSIVRLLRATPRRHAVKFSRHNVYARDRGCCQYCGQHVQRDAFTYDHVVPRVRGGVTSWENVVVACVPCNQRKAGRTPAQAGMKLLSTPAKPRSLPEPPGPLPLEHDLPESWKEWLRHALYWDGELTRE